MITFTETMIEPIDTYQQDFFKSDEVCLLEARLALYKQSLDRVRKGTFARINKIEGKYEDLRHEFEQLKKMICQYEKGIE